MRDRILRLGVDELRHALDLIDPVRLVADELVGRETGRAGPKPPQNCRLVSAPGTRTDTVLLEDLHDGPKCLMPGSCLRELRDAALTTLAARELLARGVVTATALGSGLSVQLQITVAARHLPGVSHVMVFPATGENEVPVELTVLDLLDQVGIDLSLAAEVSEAVFGANLVIITGAGQDQLRIGQVTCGAVLVNASGRDLPGSFVEGVDEIYVDDARLLDDNRHRQFIRVRLTGSGTAPESFRPIEGWHPHRGWRGRRQVDADVGEVLTGAHPGRTRADDVLLVELLGMRELDVPLAVRLRQAALEHGIGVWTSEQ